MTPLRIKVGQGCYVLGSIVVSGNPGALAAGGETVRLGTLVLGILLVVLSCVCLSSMSGDELLLVLVTCSPLPLIELLVLLQHETGPDTAPAFRLICYLYYIAGALIATSLRRGDAPSVMLLICGIVAACVLSIGYLVFLSSTQLLPGRNTIDDEALHPVGVACSFSLIVVTCLGILFNATTGVVKLLCLLAMISGLGCVIFTGSRGAMLSLFITIGFSFFVRMRFGGRLAAYTHPGAILKMASGALILFAVCVLFRETLEPQLEYVENRFTEYADTGSDVSMEQRAQLRSDYLDHLGEWWVLGYYGYDGTYPHNIVFEAWLRFGLFGLAMCAGVVVASRKLLSMARFHPGTCVLSVISLQGLFTLISAQTSLSLEFQRTLWAACGAGITLVAIGKCKHARSMQEARGSVGRRGSGRVIMR